ncbi:hypothetical protein [Alkalicoccobacillus porphyridii]|uniref:Uncharacterized protein n=1 Tax=Alkalicoccobacillus porphyridii TaxID=2597270 RepID=A0A553ZXQ9_9BACI|nr:hypothetical protein [Alkalicoccobacillus porphyridii]TSB46136.1 hypothetical protein FN960_12280 [Alkalicoccobacillus porphyridii]
MNKEDKLKALGEEMKKGIELIRDKKDQEGLEKLQPFAELMRSGNARQMRVFVNIGLAQLRLQDIEGFLQTYEEVQGIPIKSEKDQTLRNEMDEWFKLLMERLEKEQ